jgi:DNA-binding transcriptional LysR family regulator
MDLELLRTFDAVARRRSFAAVARERNVDPSLVSRGVAALEAELGVRLLQRTTRSMVLTEAGELFLARLAPLLEELDQAFDEGVATRKEPVGTVRLTASLSFSEVCLAPLLKPFRDAFPRLRLELILSDENLDLLTERIDLAIRLAPSFRADVVGVKLFDTHYRVVASSDYVRRAGMPAKPNDLSGRDCILFTLPEFRTRWLFRDAHGIEEVPVLGSLEISNALTIKRAALDGLGPALLADWTVAADLQAGRLVDLFPRYQVAATSFETAAWLLYPSREHLPFKVRAAIAFLRQRLRAPNGESNAVQGGD